MPASSSFKWTDKKPMNVANFKAVKKVCLYIEGVAKRNCPVDTGNLRNSLATVMGAAPDDPTLGFVGTNVEYAAFVEFGTRHQAAQPYLGPALEDARRRFG